MLGTQTQRSKQNFNIGGQRMPIAETHARAILKKGGRARQPRRGLAELANLRSDRCCLQRNSLPGACRTIFAGRPADGLWNAEQ